ncbi:MAG: hypothetical protein F4Y27_12430 [Acidimicrobiaceae bacterium]|nr:hypothetical protein [Acidimicrobiaceae bacterium]MXW62484.1 hypothetical protein [Acidimicrobiaceae bacterium]MXW77346.1 hypothetical protein [Acidimicrobiaceae bacterium]MYA75470.1 hypothetical protein [Acidimicrobiaceae bacterium]MYC43616.1 hypothetical protein [Acidimicrobiaceae bacterium]
MNVISRSDFRLIGKQTLGIFVALIVLMSALAVVVPKSEASADHTSHCTTTTTNFWGVVGYRQEVVETHYHATYPYVTYTYRTVPVYGYLSYTTCTPIAHWEHENTGNKVACVLGGAVPVIGPAVTGICFLAT